MTKIIILIFAILFVHIQANFTSLVLNVSSCSCSDCCYSPNSNVTFNTNYTSNSSGFSYVNISGILNGSNCSALMNTNDNCTLNTYNYDNTLPQETFLLSCNNLSAHTNQNMAQLKHNATDGPWYLTWVNTNESNQCQLIGNQVYVVNASNSTTGNSTNTNTTSTNSTNTSATNTTNSNTNSTSNNTNSTNLMKLAVSLMGMIVLFAGMILISWS